MKKLTLQFRTLTDLGRFLKLITGGYLLNTNNLTITASMPQIEINLALDLYNANVIETSEKVFSYDMMG